MVVSSATGVRIGLGCAAAAWGSLVVGSACGDGQGEIPSFAPIERSLCERVVECDCGESFALLGLVPPLSCDGWTIAHAVPEGYDPYGYYGGPDEDEPRSIDEQCLRAIASRIDAGGCGEGLDPYFALEKDCRDFCWPVVGPALEGYACRRQEDCGRGLLCDGGECRDPCTPRVPFAGQECRGQEDCGDALLCVPGGDSNRCQAPPGPGDPCIFEACGRGLRCDTTGAGDAVCVMLTANGDACTGHRECASNNCPAGFCVGDPGNDPGLGRCGVEGPCPSGTRCTAGPGEIAECVPEAGACPGLATLTSALAVEVIAAGG